MCGLAGFVDYKKSTSLEVLKAMTDSLVHRGPDDCGYDLIELNKGTIGLGFRRLSIIDLSPNGHQPMYSPDQRIALMLNGEIYNFLEIRKELEEKGVVFKSNSDTEVVLYSYLVWGIEMLKKFVGMFAIVLVDKRTNEVFLIRDRVGIKPLFWHKCKNGSILFASELKSFHKHPDFIKKLNIDALSLFFMHGSIPAPYTIFENTFKMKPGHWMKFNLETHEILDVEYWNGFDPYNTPVFNIDYNEAKQETEKLMQSAFEYRMISDVPVGVFLSGGYDSTAVAALLSKTVSNLNTYTIGFEDESFNEAPYAKKVADFIGTKHHEYTCRYSDAMKIIPELADIYDEPFGDPSAIPTTLVSRIARQHVTVALSADAGDELFAGYPRHLKSSKYLHKLFGIPEQVKSFSLIPIHFFSYLYNPVISRPDMVEKLKLFLQSRGIAEGFNVINQTYSEKEIKKLLNRPFVIPNTVFNEDLKLESSVSVLNKILAIEYRTYLTDDILQKVDRASMSCGLEGREPFLDHRLFEFVATLPDEFKLKNGISKMILKDIVHDYVPKEIMERPKMGFGIPLKDWLRYDLRELFEDVLDIKKIESQGVLNVQAVKDLKLHYLNGKLYDIYRLWYVFIFQQWYDRWMD